MGNRGGTMKINEIDKAWMAGFVDGEGWIGIVKQVRNVRPSPAYRTVIKISNTRRKSIDFFVERYGGTAWKGKDAYQWDCPKANIKKLLCDIKPFLVIKTNQAQILLDFIERFERHKKEALNFKEDYYKEVKEANRNKYKEKACVIK